MGVGFTGFELVAILDDGDDAIIAINNEEDRTDGDAMRQDLYLCTNEEPRGEGRWNGVINSESSFLRNQQSWNSPEPIRASAEAHGGKAASSQSSS